MRLPPAFQDARIHMLALSGTCIRRQTGAVEALSGLDTIQSTLILCWRRRHPSNWRRRKKELSFTVTLRTHLLFIPLYSLSLSLSFSGDWWVCPLSLIIGSLPQAHVGYYLCAQHTVFVPLTLGMKTRGTEPLINLCFGCLHEQHLSKNGQISYYSELKLLRRSKLFSVGIIILIVKNTC